MKIFSQAMLMDFFCVNFLSGIFLLQETQRYKLNSLNLVSKIIQNNSINLRRFSIFIRWIYAKEGCKLGFRLWFQKQKLSNDCPCKICSKKTRSLASVWLRLILPMGFLRPRFSLKFFQSWSAFQSKSTQVILQPW